MIWNEVTSYKVGILVAPRFLELSTYLTFIMNMNLLFQKKSVENGFLKVESLHIHLNPFFHTCYITEICKIMIKNIIFSLVQPAF